jgi:hypothetical protein
MASSPFEVLIGLKLSIVRRAADMLVLHFGNVRRLPFGLGSVGVYAFHVQCPWRFDAPDATLTGSYDLYEFAGAGVRPSGWKSEDGFSLQDRVLDHVIGSYDDSTRSWYNESDRFVVMGADRSPRGDVTLHLSDGYAFRVFPAGISGESWRFFAQGSKQHAIFPETEWRHEA